MHTVERLQTELSWETCSGQDILSNYIKTSKEQFTLYPKGENVECRTRFPPAPSFWKTPRPLRYCCPNTTVTICQNKQLHTLDITFSLEQVVPNFLLFVHVAKLFITSPLPLLSVLGKRANTLGFQAVPPRLFSYSTRLRIATNETQSTGWAPKKSSICGLWNLDLLWLSCGNSWNLYIQNPLKCKKPCLVYKKKQ